jgi:hypothetical protein
MNLNKATLIYIILLFALFVCIYSIEYQYASNHEKTHELINDYYQCYNIETKTNWNLTGYNKYFCTIPNEKYISVLEMHSMNEIVSYNLIFMRISIYLFIMFILLLTYTKTIIKLNIGDLT